MKALILQVFYQPEGVSLRFYPQPEANAFRLIKPNRCNNYYLFNLVSGTLSNAFRLIKSMVQLGCSSKFLTK